MEELIKVTQNEQGNNVVSARELHEKLEVGRDFTTWIKGRIDRYNFEENVDFTVVWNDTKTGDVVNYNGNSNSMVKLGYQCDFAITIDMAKELCMVENNDLGRKARRYFIECEKQLTQVQKLSAKEQLALKLFNGGIDAVEAHKQLLALETKPLEEKINQQEQVIKEYEPKVTYYDIVLQSEGLVSITQIAKDYGMSGKRLNSILHDLHIQYKQGNTWLLYAEHQSGGYTKSTTYVDGNNVSHLSTKWSQKGRLFLYQALKEDGYLPLIEQ